MNFENMWSIHHGHSDVMYVFAPHSSPWLYELFPSFWIIALPVMSIVAPTFMWPDIVGMYHYVKKRTLVRRATKACLNELAFESDALTQDRLHRGSRPSEPLICVANRRLNRI